jgi:hypothetical protein
MKSFVFALALAGFALAGCAAEEAETDVVVTEEADVVTPPADDMMMADTSMTDTTMVMEADTMMADTTAGM